MFTNHACTNFKMAQRCTCILLKYLRIMERIGEEKESKHDIILKVVHFVSNEECFDISGAESLNRRKVDYLVTLF